jgi:hypothetical protein
MKKIVLTCSDFDFEKLKKQKASDGFAAATWEKWLLSKGSSGLELTETEQCHIGTKTMHTLWWKNIGHNLAYIRRKDTRSLRQLAKIKSEGPAVVVGAGPSVWQHKHLDVLKNSGYRGIVVACDKMLKPLLEHGIVPNYVMTVDGTELIIPFYKNKAFREHVKDIKVLLHFTANPKLVRYLYRLKADIYWFIIHTEMILTPEDAAMQSVCMTMTKHNPDGLQTIVSGGNVGVGAWAFSWVVLKANPVILIGYDMGYPEGTNLHTTYYYSALMNKTQEQIADSTAASLTVATQYQKEYNPAFKCWAYTDVVFRQYKAIFGSFLSHSPANVTTINCTEGGTLHHPRLQHATLAETLKKYRV